jgi:hypothetical protein
MILRLSPLFVYGDGCAIFYNKCHFEGTLSCNLRKTNVIEPPKVFHLSDNVASWQALPKKALTGSGTGHKRQ